MRPKILAQFSILAGTLALAIAQGVLLLFILLVRYWLHREPKSKLSSPGFRGGMTDRTSWRGLAASSVATIPLRVSPNNNHA